NRFDSQYPHFDSTYSRGIPDLRSVLQVAQLLRTQQQDIQGALTCCRAALGLGRSYGDQPSLVAMNIRSTTNLKIVQMLERVLAQGQALDIDLHTLQQSLEDEASQPLFLIGARGERAEIDRIYQAAEDGSLSQAEFALLDDLVKPDRFLRKSYKQPRAADLRFWTQVVEIAKYPVEEQEAQFARLQGLSSPFNSGDGLAFGSIEGTGQRVG